MSHKGQSDYIWLQTHRQSSQAGNDLILLETWGQLGAIAFPGVRRVRDGQMTIIQNPANSDNSDFSD